MPRLSETNANVELYNQQMAAGIVGAEHPIITDHLDGTYTIQSFDVLLYDNVYHYNGLKKFTIPAETRDITAFANEIVYIVVDYNGGSPILVDLTSTELYTINESDIIPIYTIFNENNGLLHTLDWDLLGQGAANKLHARFVKTQRFQRENGLELSVTNPARSLQLSAGKVWAGASAQILGAGDIAAGDVPSSLTDLAGGTGYDDGEFTNVATTYGGAGTGLTVDIRVESGIILRADINTAGSGYTTRDVVTINHTSGAGATVTIVPARFGFWFHSSGVWNFTFDETGGGVYNNTQYDDGTDVQTLAAGEYAVNWIYRDIEHGTHMGHVLATQPYNTYAQAVGSHPRTDLPFEFGVLGILVGRVIVVKDGTDGIVESAFADVTLEGFNQAHSGLAGLQGGQTDEYFHMDSAQKQQLDAGYPVVLSNYMEKPANASEQDIHGALNSLGSSALPLAINKGIGKVFLNVTALGASGTVTITGTKIDRDTGVDTTAFVDTITVDSVTTDNSTTDANGNATHEFVNGYISNEWFVGTLTIAHGTATGITAEGFHVSFEQFNDEPNVVIDTYDINVFANNTNAAMAAHLYAIEKQVGTDKADITEIAECIIDYTPVANTYQRLRKGNLAKSLNCTTDGIFTEQFYNGAGLHEFVSTKVWARILPEV